MTGSPNHRKATTMIVTTTNTVEGHTIDQYIRIVAGETVVGINMFKDIGAGFRNLVPELREAKDLSFDVLPMPTIDTRATIGDISGLCLSKGSDVQGDADHALAIGRGAYT